MKNKLMTIAIALALVILLVRVFEKPLLAQITAALTQNVDEPGRNAFQLNAEATDLTNEKKTFFTVPVGKRYVIESYSASCASPTDESLTGVTIETFVAGQSAEMSAPAFLRYGNSGGRQWGATGNSRLYADPGTTIAMEVSTSGSSTFSCTYSVVGYVINLFTVKKP